ncbi:MAG: hypothetical protein ACFFDS_02140 [Candidatus Thorarchaeota archaeon]
MAIFLYMIRNGQFAEDYGFKLILTLIGLFICVLFIILTKNYDYLFVFITGIVIWSSFELIITALGIRYIVDATFFNLDLNWILAAILRGCSEGGIVALVGIIFGDYIPRKKSMKFALPAGLILISYFVFRTIMNKLAFRDVGGDVSSRRAVFAWPSVVFFAFFLIFNVIWFIYQKDPQIRKRAISMFVTVLVFATIWSVAQYIANTRWVEISSNGGFEQTTVLVTILIFAWDLILEVALCYLSFFTIQNSLRHYIKIKKETKKIQ